MGAPWRAAAAAALLSCAACDDGGGEPKYLEASELMDPQACAACHPDHVREWSGSMHAYAGDDPVFLAMNARGQRETEGRLGSFCVQCHAPMALRTGATTDGLNLPELPQHLKGVTCYFCHSVDEVMGEHNNALHLWDDGVMRGGISDPHPSSPHRAAYSPLHDRGRAESARMCGSCHDVVLPTNVHLERTFAEWRGSLYAKPDRTTQLTCGQCHMEGRDGPAATASGLPVRRLHDHSMPGVDVALTDFPELAAQREGVQRALDATLITKLCVKPFAGGVDAVLSLDNAFAGHAWPSGSAHIRRAWAEVTAYAGGQILHQSGAVPADQPVLSVAGADPDLWVLRDRAFDYQDNETMMFWEILSKEAELLPPAVTKNPADPAYYHQVERTYRVADQIPDRITARVHIRPVDFDLVDSLVASGDLDAVIRGRLSTFTVGPEVEWTPDRGFTCVP